jgi:hypothetical protein
MSNSSMEEIYKHRLDTYYLATIGYGVTLVVYAVIAGTVIGDRFELRLSLWNDPIIYLLAACALFSLVALIITAVLNRTVIIRDKELAFHSRLRQRAFAPEDIEWIGFRPESRLRTRGEQSYPAAKIKLRSRRRPLRLRPSSFERGGAMARSIKAWAQRNGVEFRQGRQRRGRGKA